MQRKESQCGTIIRHVDKHDSINSIEAIRMYGITRLAARIHELKNTSNAMKAIADDSVAPGFVTYVPDESARKRYLLKAMYRRMDAAHEYLKVGNPDMGIVARIFTELAIEANRAANA